MKSIPKCSDCYYFNITYKLGKVGYICKAFPNGIPKDILNNQIRHDHIIKGQVGNYIFVPREEEVKKREAKTKRLDTIIFTLVGIYILGWGILGEIIPKFLKPYSTGWWIAYVLTAIPMISLILYGLLWLFNKIYKFYKNWQR